MEPFDFSQLYQETAQGVASLVGSGSYGALLGYFEGLSGDAERLLEQQPGGDRAHIACGPGCCNCCVVNVATLIPEGVAIIHYLQQLERVFQERLSARLDSLWCEVRGLDEEERLFLRRKCAFLDDQGSCLIYPVRPLLCRSITSTSAEKCREALAGQIFGECPPVLMHLLQQQLYETLFAGIADGLEQAGLDGRSYQLSGLVRFLLRYPDAESELIAGRRLTWQDLY